MIDKSTDNNDSSPSSSFDYVIVGAGPSAMGLLYGLLESYIKKDASASSSSPTRRHHHHHHHCPSIAIIERGTGPPHDPSTTLPSQWYEAANNTQSSSVTILSTEICGREMKLPIGKGLGGTSNINACLCTKPLKRDLDQWPEPWKSNLWPCINHIRSTLKENNVLHHCGQNGRSNIAMQDVPSPYHPKSSLDLTAKVPILAKQQQQQGIGRRWERVNFYDALIEPLLVKYPYLKDNLHWIQGTEAQRLLTKGDKVYGVECYSFQNNRLFNVLSSNHLFLCAGAIESPTLLLLSKIKRKDGVGKNLQDQVVLPRAYVTPFWQPNTNPSINGIAAHGNFFIKNKNNKNHILEIHVADSVANSSILPRIPSNVLRRHRRSTTSSSSRIRMIQTICDIFFYILEVTIKCLILYAPIGYFLRHFTAVSNLCLMHPYSKGEVNIILAQHQHKPSNSLGRRNVSVEVKVGYLEDHRDIETLRIGSSSLDKLVRRSSYFEILPGFLLRGLKVFGIDWFLVYCKFFALPYYHFSGTCRMQASQCSNGDDEDWVVDTNLKLRDMEGISICDASVFPAMVSTPPALSCASLGYGHGKSFVK